MEEQAEVENAWNIIRSGAQVQKVSEYAGRLPGTVKQTMHKVPLADSLTRLTHVLCHKSGRLSWSRTLEGIVTDEKG
jgi:hypothetical protein